MYFFAIHACTGIYMYDFLYPVSVGPFIKLIYYASLYIKLYKI